VEGRKGHGGEVEREQGGIKLERRGEQGRDGLDRRSLGGGLLRL
jgi:hypothetical protein